MRYCLRPAFNGAELSGQAMPLAASNVDLMT